MRTWDKMIFGRQKSRIVDREEWRIDRKMMGKLEEEDEHERSNPGYGTII